MPEENNIKGERWTRETEAILKSLGWSRHGDLNFDISCHLHKKERKGQPHGVDILMSYFEPYDGGSIPVIVESKTRQWESINTKAIESWVEQVLTTLECAHLAPELRPFGFDGPAYKYGVVAIWCNDGKYDDRVFREYLSKMSVPTKRLNYRIFVLGNAQILWLCEMADVLLQMRDSGCSWDFHYPSVSDRDLYQGKELSLFMMFSEFAFVRASRRVEEGGISRTEKLSIVFLNAKPTLKVLNFMYEAFKKYQLQEADRYVFYANSRYLAQRTEVEEFLTNVRDAEPRKKIDVKFINSLDSVPDRILHGGEV